MPNTKYKRGANFERQTLKYLIGDNTHATTGLIHTLLPLLIHPTKDTLPSVYGIRTAGSRGNFDLLLSFMYPSGNGFVVGIQCKIGKQSERRMDSDLQRIKKHTNIYGVYALKEKGYKDPVFYPLIHEVLHQCIRRVYDEHDVGY